MLALFKNVYTNIIMNFTKLKYEIKLLLGKHPNVKIDLHTKTERHGSDYGGWNILENSLSDNSIVYSAGIGTDISFDLSIIQKYRCDIFGFDPTPEVAQWLKSQEVPNSFYFEPVGISAINETVKFFLPENPQHISHSAKPANANQKSIDLPVCNLQTIMRQKQHSYIDLLKMDIEGFEYAVIEDLLLQNLSIKQLLVEFHHGMYGYKNSDTTQAIDKLRLSGFKLFKISDSGREYSFYKYENL